jgi:hypothetical protein
MQGAQGDFIPRASPHADLCNWSARQIPSFFHVALAVLTWQPSRSPVGFRGGEVFLWASIETRRFNSSSAGDAPCTFLPAPALVSCRAASFVFGLSKIGFHQGTATAFGT